MSIQALNLIDSLIRHAEEALAVPETDVDQVLGKLDRYLVEFEKWQESLGGKNPLAKDSLLSPETQKKLRTQIEKLSTLHQQVVTRAETNRQGVHRQIAEIRKRTQALKAYIDRYPSRITIAGKREG